MSAIGRRQALRTLAVSGLGAVAAPSWFERLGAVAEAHAQTPAVPAAASWTPRVLDAHQDELVTAVSELIIPATDTPGAKAALVNRFIDAVLEDSDEDDRKDFLKGLAWMDSRSRELFGTDFVKAAPGQQAALMTIISSDRNTAHEDEVGMEFFEAIKRMTVTGYYTSEIGMKELKEDGGLFFAEAGGCVHPEHGGTAPPRPPGTPPRKKG